MHRGSLNGNMEFFENKVFHNRQKIAAKNIVGKSADRERK